MSPQISARIGPYVEAGFGRPVPTVMIHVRLAQVH
jgi:hypothetical protein